MISKKAMEVACLGGLVSVSAVVAAIINYNNEGSATGSFAAVGVAITGLIMTCSAVVCCNDKRSPMEYDNMSLVGLEVQEGIN